MAMQCDVLTGNTGGDDNDVSTGQSKLQAIVLGKVAVDFLFWSAWHLPDWVYSTPTATEEM
jgi:hypothetical protein